MCKKADHWISQKLNERLGSKHDTHRFGLPHEIFVPLLPGNVLGGHLSAIAWDRKWCFQLRTLE